MLDCVLCFLFVLMEALGQKSIMGGSWDQAFDKSHNMKILNPRDSYLVYLNFWKKDVYNATLFPDKSDLSHGFRWWLRKPELEFIFGMNPFCNKKEGKKMGRGKHFCTSLPASNYNTNYYWSFASAQAPQRQTFDSFKLPAPALLISNKKNQDFCILFILLVKLLPVPVVGIDTSWKLNWDKAEQMWTCSRKEPVWRCISPVLKSTGSSSQVSAARVANSVST